MMFNKNLLMAWDGSGKYYTWLWCIKYQDQCRIYLDEVNNVNP